MTATAVSQNFLHVRSATAGSSWARRHAAVNIAVTIALTLLLFLAISGRSLWTDEAFSWFIAAHPNLRSLWSALARGDSSDLQMIGYYSYLHAWTLLFGWSEWAMRAANLPFAVLFSGALVHLARNVLRLDWPIVVAASVPFPWEQVNNARPYFIVTALSMLVCCGLFEFLHASNPARRKAWTFVVLVAMWAALLFHMLAGLAVLPFALFLVLRLRGDSARSWREWSAAGRLMALPYLGLSAYFGWTFLRGTSYDYLAPDAISMASVLFRLAGLGAYSPNRRYDVPFAPYLAGMAASAAVLVLCLAALAFFPRRHHRGIENDRSTSQERSVIGHLALVWLLAAGQVLALTLIVRKQIDVRHLAALHPFLLSSLFLLCRRAAAADWPLVTVVACCGLLTVWTVADYRLLRLPDYRIEDFRSAVAAAMRVHRAQNAAVLVDADPAGAAYYGLAVSGPPPCFPLSSACEQALRLLPGARIVPAIEANNWSEQKIREWLAARRRARQSTVLLASRQRHPLYTDSAWTRILHSMATTDSLKATELEHPYGFAIYLLR